MQSTTLIRLRPCVGVPFLLRHCGLASQHKLISLLAVH